MSARSAAKLSFGVAASAWVSNGPLIAGSGQVLFSFLGMGLWEGCNTVIQGATCRRRVEMVRVSERGAPGLTFVSAFSAGYVVRV